jgi:hypothetical protein
MKNETLLGARVKTRDILSYATLKSSTALSFILTSTKVVVWCYPR